MSCKLIVVGVEQTNTFKSHILIDNDDIPSIDFSMGCVDNLFYKYLNLSIHFTDIRLLDLVHSIGQLDIIYGCIIPLDTKLKKGGWKDIDDRYKVFVRKLVLNL